MIEHLLGWLVFAALWIFGTCFVAGLTMAALP